MAYEMKPDTGSLFKNDRREKETQPQAKGSALIGGVEYWVSAWTNTANSGEKYQSLKFSRKDENRAPRPVDAGRSQAANSAPESRPEPDDFDDDIPF